MKKAGLIVSIILLTGVITFTLLRHRSSSNVQLVKFKGIENITNISKGHLEWMSINHYGNRMNAIPAQQNDFIYGLSSQDDEGFFVIQNKEQTDKVLNVRFDSLGAYLDEHLVTLFFHENERAVTQWLSQSTQEDFRHLQSVYISDGLTENNFQKLKEMGKYTSGIGLIMDTESQYTEALLQALKPSWLWFGSVKISAEGQESMKKIKDLESLILIDANIRGLTFGGFKKLNMLHIVDPDTIIPLQFTDLPKTLTALQISEAAIRDVNFLKDNTQLMELAFNNCSLLRDISALENFPRLQALSFASCDSIPDLTPLNSLKNLKWFAPPRNISEQQLASIINASPNLQTLVLVDCQQVKSLHLIENAHKLSYLALISTPLIADSLVRFKNLKYLAYGAGHSNDSISIARLQKEMPNTLVTAAEPFCLSTAWLIVFFVMLMALVLTGIKLKNRIRA